MATLLVDSPPETQGEHAPDASAGAPAEPAPAATTPAGAERICSGCGAPMAAGQDWCLQCGAGAAGSLAQPSWRSAAVILGTVLVLVLGAGAAAVAALNKNTSKVRVVSATVARVPPAVATTPATSATVPGTAPGAVATTPSVKPTLPLGTVKPPKIPLTAATPSIPSPSAATTPSATSKAGSQATKTPTSTSTAPSTSASGGAGEASQPTAILLDTNAASTYNPYNLPASGFGDPSLAIDGDPSTAWTATVNPATAPSMAQGLAIDLKSKQQVAALKLITSTPGMTVQVYGTSGETMPASITDPAWVPLSHLELVRKKHLRLKLRDSSKAFSFITLWISTAPKSSVGTPEAPGHVDVNEVELLPPS